MDEFIAFRKVEGLSNKWTNRIYIFIKEFLDSNNWTIDKKGTLDYLNKIQQQYSTTSFRKITYQIRKFLTYINIDWAKDITPPAEPNYLPERITIQTIKDTISQYQSHRYYQQIRAAILLGTTSGLRAEEIYQLYLNSTALDNRLIYVNHNPSNGQSTKTKHSRISFINLEAKIALEEYIEYFESSNNLMNLFSQSHIIRQFKSAPIQVKDLRKFFSQQWDRRGGPTSIKKILMGHSLRNDVDLMHYNAQSPEDLKQIYDKVMGDFRLED